MPEMHRFYLNSPLFSPVKNGPIRSGKWGVSPYESENSILKSKFSLGCRTKMHSCEHVAHVYALAHCIFVCFTQL